MKTIPKSDMMLISGEVYVLDPKDRTQVIYSTATLEGVKQLDRERFVKPVDAKSLANEEAKLFYSEPSEIKSHFKLGFKAGYNANKAEFTKQDMANVFGIAFDLGRTQKSFTGSDFEKAMYANKKLSLPQSIELENDIITNVNW